MSRHLTEVEVWNVIESMMRAGEKPTTRSVRERLGRGSMGSINPAMDTWYALRAPVFLDPNAGNLSTDDARLLEMLKEFRKEVASRIEANLEDRLATQEAELNVARSRIAEERAELDAAKEAQQESLERTFAMAEELRRSLESAQNRILALSTESEELRSALRTEQAERARAESLRDEARQVAELSSKELNQLKHKLTDALRELDRHSNALDGKTAALKQAEKQVAMLTARAEKLIAGEASMRTTLSHLQAERDQMAKALKGRAGGTGSAKKGAARPSPTQRTRNT